MKEIPQSKIVIVLLTLASFSLLFYSCESTRTGPVVPAPPVTVQATSPLILTGFVKDEASVAAVSGARVVLRRPDGTTIVSIVTDINGKYQYDVTTQNITQLDVFVSASSYGTSSAKAVINKQAYTAYVGDIYLQKVSGTTSTVSAATGGQVITSSRESISTTQLTITVPPGSMTQSAPITISSMPMNNVIPLSSSTNQLITAAASLEPSGLTFLTPVTVTFPLPYSTTAGKNLIHYKLNETTLLWENVGNAVVNSDGKSADVQLTEFSLHSLGDQGSVVLTGSDSSQIEEQFLLSEGQSQSHIYTPLININTDIATLGYVWISDQIAEITHFRVDNSGAPLALTINTGTAVAPPLPDDKKQTGANGEVFYFNPDNPNEAGTWIWQGVYERFLITMNFTITIGERSGTITLTIKGYGKVGDSYTWVPSHNQGG